ncbi:hypothetical protein [Telluribacter sp. SYSU D00476]|uniref:hypothetical protein n=1 Tax=Telluribacter sp. SYSU D00476 TaxID=2811430 RepID=UPI001FF2676B|nr:hypothetical protein [Telluribacter sp. SYSU D00476]
MKAINDMMEGVPKENRSDFEWTMFFGIWGFVLIALPALYMTIKSTQDKKQIIQNQTYQTATIVHVKKVFKSRASILYIRFYYQYSYQGKIFSDYRDYKYQRYFVHFTEDKWKYVEGRQFPVILSSEEPSKNSILMFWSDFSQYSLPFPDSLKWSEEVFYNQ